MSPVVPGASYQVKSASRSEGSTEGVTNAIARFLNTSVDKGAIGLRGHRTQESQQMRTCS